MPSDQILLNCWIYGESPKRLFSVWVLKAGNVNVIKKQIKAEKQAFQNIDADALDLWRVSLPGDENLKRSLQNLDLNERSRLSPIAPLSIVFSDIPKEGHVHIVIKAPPGATIRPGSSKESNRSSNAISRQSPPPPSPESSPRKDTVSALYERMNKYSFIQVRGTPGSGKSVLAKLLCEHIIQKEPTAHVIWIPIWPFETVKQSGGYRSYLRTNGWVESQNTIFIFDEAQTSYEDVLLWTDFFKSMHEYHNRRAVIFASYGSPTSQVVLGSTRICLHDPQRVTLCQIQHMDGLPPVGLLFPRKEFDDLISRLYPKAEHFFDQSFFDGVFDITGGHVGAVYDFLKIVAAHDSYRSLKHSPGLYTWESFLEMVGLPYLLEQVQASTAIFRRGLPQDHDLRDPAIARIFSAVLRDGLVYMSDFDSPEDKGALQKCFYNGWLHTDRVPNPDVRREEVGHFFSSQLHRWYVEWKLWDIAPGTPFDATDILKFTIDVISKFSPQLLSAERSIGPGRIQRRPEAQFQDEFYRSCHICSNGSLVTFPEYGTPKGRIDFYIPSKQWGVGLLRDGDRLADHSRRFSRSGSYANTLSLSDYISLDCRVTQPTVPHPGYPGLYHVIFTNNFQNVSILDNMLKPVPGGEFALSASIS